MQSVKAFSVYVCAAIFLPSYLHTTCGFRIWKPFKFSNSCIFF